MSFAVQTRDAQTVVRFLRHQVRSLSQEALARMCGVAQSTITRAETGQGLTDPRKAAAALRGLGAPLELPPGQQTASRDALVPDVDALARALIHPSRSVQETFENFGTAALEKAARLSKTAYQACRYTEACALVTRLIPTFDAEPDASRDTPTYRRLKLESDVYHVTASLLLKYDERGLAALAADRGRRAARASRDPILTGANNRIRARCLMREGRVSMAGALSTGAAEHVSDSTALSTASAISVYGALLLTAAAAEAKQERRSHTLSLLREAQRASGLLGGDHNHRWTAFGPTNVLLHRVSAAVDLGDAGTAIEAARRVRPEAVPLTERRVALHVDTARAFSHWGKYREAFAELLVAEGVAPSELRDTPKVHTLIRVLHARARGPLERSFTRMADRAGVDL